jgi:hypothetical protein
VDLYSIATEAFIGLRLPAAFQPCEFAFPGSTLVHCMHISPWAWIVKLCRWTVQMGCKTRLFVQSDVTAFSGRAGFAQKTLCTVQRLAMSGESLSG